MVSLGLVSSSITSSMGRPAMPPPALNFSTAHCVALSPLSPALAAIPERGARMPTLQGLACATAGANTPGAVAPAPVAANEVRRARRESFMGRPLRFGCAVCERRLGGMIYQPHVSNNGGRRPPTDGASRGGLAVGHVRTRPRRAFGRVKLWPRQTFWPVKLFGPTSSLAPQALG